MIDIRHANAHALMHGAGRGYRPPGLMHHGLVLVSVRMLARCSRWWLWLLLTHTGQRYTTFMHHHVRSTRWACLRAVRRRCAASSGARTARSWPWGSNDNTLNMGCLEARFQLHHTHQPSRPWPEVGGHLASGGGASDGCIKMWKMRSGVKAVTMMMTMCRASPSAVIVGFFIL